MQVRRKSIVFPALLAAVILALGASQTLAGSFTGKPAHPGDRVETILVDGISRSYLLILPDSFPPHPMALVFVLHGGRGSASGVDKLTSFRAIARTNSFILVYPQGMDKSWNDGRPTQAMKKGIDDVKFFSLLMDKLQASYPVNPRMIYVAGISNGGFMTSRLAMELSGRIAAAAVVAATIDSGAGDSVRPNPVSMLYIHGTEDPLVPFAGGHVPIGTAKKRYFISHQAALNYWVGIDHCHSHPVVSTLPDLSDDGTTVTRYVYEGGENGTEVWGYTITNGGHTWPGGWQYLPAFIVGKTCRDFSASRVIWDFFAAHPKP